MSCNTLSVKDSPDFGHKGLDDNGYLLSLAALSAEYVQDIYSRDFLYSRIAEEFLREGKNAQALEILRRATRVARSDEDLGQKHQILIELARFYIRANDVPTAVEMLDEALLLVTVLDDEPQRGAGLEAIIETCFSIPEAFGEILRTAIDYVYVLEDPVMRVQLLTDLGQKYQQINVRNRTRSLLQQSIAAAAAIVNPWAKAEAYSRIAKRFLAEESEIEFETYINLSIEELNSVDVLAISEGDAQILLRTLTNMADVGKFREAVTLIARVPYLQARVNAQLAVVERYLQQGSVLQARLLVQRLSSELDGNEDEELILSTLVRLTEVFGNANFVEDSRLYGDAAVEFLENTGIANTSPYYARLALSFLKQGRIDDSLALTARIKDQYVASQSYREVAEVLMGIDDDRIPNLLSAAESSALEATYLRESALAAIATSHIKSGNIADGLSILGRLEDPYTLGTTAVDIASLVYPDSGGLAVLQNAADHMENPIWKNALARLIDTWNAMPL